MDQYKPFQKPKFCKPRIVADVNILNQQSVINIQSTKTNFKRSPITQYLYETNLQVKLTKTKFVKFKNDHHGCDFLLQVTVALQVFKSSIFIIMFLKSTTNSLTKHFLINYKFTSNMIKYHVSTSKILHFGHRRPWTRGKFHLTRNSMTTQR